jgi:adenylosuccinate lyase
MLTISPIDGRYKNKTNKLVNYFSEEAQLSLKCRIEIDYFIYLASQLKLDLSLENHSALQLIKDSINVEEIKLIEQKTKHDIKAVEYYLREKFVAAGIPHDNFIHFGLTSQDINSLAISHTLQTFNSNAMLEELSVLFNSISYFAESSDILFPARTHGQLAVPTNLKKEINVFVYRLKEQIKNLFDYNFSCKFGGAVGNFSAHYIAYPKIDWRRFADNFIKSYDLDRSRITTQVDNNASISAYFNIIRMINNILIDFCRDIWMYNSYGYFKQSTTKEEVGSSVMPQKVNPISFENAEGNLELSNSILSFMSDKLQISRMQRDLSDSTIIRNIGVPLAYSFIAYKSIVEGVKKLQINKENIQKDLQNEGLLAEAYQTILRKENIKDAYELIKTIARDKNGTIDSLNVSEEVKNKLKSITLQDYEISLKD